MARLRRNTFYKRLCGAFEATHFQRALKWRVSDKSLSMRVFVALQRVSLENPLFLGPAPRLEMQLEGDKVVPLCITAPDINEEERQP